MPLYTKIRKKNSNETKLWVAFSQFIRLRDTDSNGIGKCFTCHRILYWKDGDCGHGIPRQHKSTKYNEQNNHLQCKRCNGFEGGKREIYKEEMDRRYGMGTWDNMEIASRKVSKTGQFEIDQMTLFYSNKANELAISKNIKL